MWIAASAALEAERRYRPELDVHSEVLQPLLAAAHAGPPILGYGSRDEQHNAAVALKAVLGECLLSS